MRISTAIALVCVAALAGCAGSGTPAAADKSESDFDRERELERRMAVRGDAGNKLPAEFPDESRTPAVGEVPDSILSGNTE